MSALPLLDSSYSRSPAVIAGRPQKPWPTMYDLPSENPEDPGLPDVFHNQQPQLLKETFEPPDYPSDKIFVATDLNLYYDRAHEHWYKRPDWFAVMDVQRLYDGHELRSSYVIWDEQVTPFLVVELLSPSTTKEDLGRTQRQSKDPPTKWEVYEQILRIPYYVVFSRHTDELHFFKLTQRRYVEIPLLAHKFWFSEIQLGLGLWNGVYDGLQRQWLRWYDAAGQWIPTPAERAHRAQRQTQEALQQAMLERQRAEVAERQTTEALHKATVAERQTTEALRRATVAEQQALLERQRAELLAAKLRALGLDPESL